MIAAPMATAKSRSLKYKDLARSEAVIDRCLGADLFARLGSETKELGDTQVRLNFSTGKGGLPRVDAQVMSECSLACQWCMESVPIELEAKFTALLVVDDAEMAYWSERFKADHAKIDLINVGEILNEAELVEDELLLSLPVQVCLDLQCANRPQRTFGQHEDEEGKKFKALEVLKAQFRTGAAEDRE
jgi:uncharacterized metal-binding protein YceD (DUF177 family)